MKYFFVLLFFVIVGLKSKAAKENISNVKITNIIVNGAALELNDYSSIVISNRDTIRFDYKLEELNGVVDGAYIFKIVFRNSEGDSAVNTSGSLNCVYSMLGEDDYELKISAFDVGGKWATEPEIFKFRVNNKEARLVSENAKLKIENKILDSTIAILKLQEPSATDYNIRGIKINKNIVFMILAVAVVLFLVMLFLLIIKIRRQKSKLIEIEDIKNILNLENKKLQIQNEADTNEMFELKKTIDKISNKMSDVLVANAEISSKIELVNQKNNELALLQENKNMLFSDILRGIADPTASIKSLVELLRSYDFNASDTKEIVENIVDATQKIILMSEDIQRLIEFEKNNEVEINCENISIKKLVDDSITMNKTDALHRKIKIESNISPEVNKYYLDYDKILIVLHNLISNAIKYTYGGGNILVSCFKSSDKESGLTFEVKDDGIGINEQDLKYFSNDLEKKQNSIEKIGLITVRKYIEVHKSKLNVVSVVGKGSTFSFTIPDLQKK